MSSFNDKSEKLIMLVGKYPCIWNPDANDYNKPKSKDSAWHQICEAMYEDFDILPDKGKKMAGLKKRWCNVRDCYRKDYTAAMAGMGNRRKRYLHASLLSYLDPVLRKRSRGDFDYSTNSEIEWVTADGDSDDSREEYEENDFKIEFDDSQELALDEDPSQGSTKRKEVPIEEFLSSLKKTKNSNEDEDDLKFLTSFASDMKAMSRKQKIDFKLGMVQLLKNVFQQNDET